MNNKNKKMFLVVIVIATLIIAVMGATFAFFSASGGSANNAVTANATTLSNLGFTSSHSKVATNLVPVSSESEYFSRYPGTGSSGCLDDVGNEICTVYEFTITNTASVTQTIYVSFVPSENTFDNMYFAAFNTSIASANYTVATGSSGSGSNFVLTPQTTASNSTLAHTATKLTKNSVTPISMPGLTATLSSGSSVTYTILVWLQETGDTQNTEQGGVFKAGVNVTTGGNSTGVTGVMEDSSASIVYTVNTYDDDALNENVVLIGQSIPDTITKYTTASSAMTDFGHNVALKHVITSGIVSESYAVINVTSEIAENYEGMVAGTHELSVGENIDNIKNIFGYNIHSERCNDYTSFFSCSESNMTVILRYSHNTIEVYDNGTDCIVTGDGISACLYR